MAGLISRACSVPSASLSRKLHTKSTSFLIKAHPPLSITQAISAGTLHDVRWRISAGKVNDAALDSHPLPGKKAIT